MSVASRADCGDVQKIAPAVRGINGPPQTSDCAGRNNPQPQKLDIGAAIHLALEELEPVLENVELIVYHKTGKKYDEYLNGDD